MTWLVENPVMIAAIGGMTAAGIAFAWLQTGHRRLIHAFVVVVVLTILGLAVESFVVSDREAIESLLHEIARRIEQDDIPRVLSHIDPSAPQVRAQAESELPKYTFSEVNVKSNLEIVFDSAQPGEAVASFNVVVAGSFRDGSKELWRVPRYAIVTFRKTNSQWRVVSYEHHDPQQGLTTKRKR